MTEITVEQMAEIRANLKHNPNGSIHSSDVLLLLDSLEESRKCTAVLQEIFDDLERATTEAQSIITEAKKNISVEKHLPNACCRALKAYTKHLGTKDD